MNSKGGAGVERGRDPRVAAQFLGHAGPFGHLSNGQSAAFLAELDHGRLQHLVALHLSEENNTPALARSGLAGVLGCAPEEVAVALQADGLGWREVR